VSIGFRMKTVEEIRAELAKLTDAQLIERGSYGSLVSPGQGKDPT
jgi:hypothetical protein